MTIDRPDPASALSTTSTTSSSSTASPTSPASAPSAPLTAQFPADFLWGTATAAHQVEGGNVGSDWWRREHRADTDLTEPSGDAADSYHRWPEDLDLVRAAGLQVYRFSVEWARVQPEPDFVSRAQLDHYRRLIDGCLERGLTPMVTLHHTTNPLWFARSGGWAQDQAPDRFARYVEAVRPILSAGVEWVCTINEPNMVATHCDWAAAEMRQVKRPAPDPVASQHLIEAHLRARQILSGIDGLRSGWTIGAQDFEALPGAEAVARAFGHPREDCFIEAARQDDFIGVQNYSRNLIGPTGPVPLPPEVETNLLGWEYYPASLGRAVQHVWRVGGGRPVFVTENGFATRQDARRIDHTAAALVSLGQAMASGVEVLGYLYWSLLDNYEWGSYEPTFGLVAWDRTTFERRPKPSLAWLAQVSRTGRVALDAAGHALDRPA
ncbi:MAG: family 1 glycosylhydrolase [Propionibacteriaceae bacterium]|jgi:beta-glucosidase|nr:family 1 glycosylhydrolase [Propionibacteriaceae bacterium]